MIGGCEPCKRDLRNSRILSYLLRILEVELRGFEPLTP
jgi:hypothetical protein